MVINIYVLFLRQIFIMLVFTFFTFALFSAVEHV